MPLEPGVYLKELGSAPDAEIDLAKAAIALAALTQPRLSTDRYINHIESLIEQTSQRHAELLASGADDDAGARLAALKWVIVEDNEYKGDIETYDDLQNASLIRVIDRRKGMPISLAILYIHIGQVLGWSVAGLDFPGHFLCRIEKDGKRIIFDPFYDSRPLDAANLRALVKHLKGPTAELSSTYFEATPNRGILIRLQNNIKYRQIDHESYEAALRTVETMKLVSPNEFRLLLDLGVLYSRTNRAAEAIRALEEYIKKAPQASDRHDAAILLQELKDSEG